MKKVFNLLGAVIGTTLLVAPVAASAFTHIAEDTKPQKTLEKADLSIISADGKDHKFSVELARTPEEQAKGEMFRTSIPEDGGMLFVWDSARPVRMWMRNTIVPLDMVFINEKGIIISIAENTVPYSEAVIPSRGIAAYTLELVGGSTQKKKIFVGDKVVCPKLSLNNASKK